ncbi:preprotein translocase subunit SecG [Croceibacterium sp. TMG7-5b_MA50]|uniref:preprotein translocase subunit SecG n=1 Tax=Croceibacterium sp. TMG7-5b_MA50 TaxID=3121290 RepID=UPI003221616D
MSLFIFLSVIQGIIAAALVGVVLMQRSEGGGLGVGGGSPGGLMSARGAADFLTRTTKWLTVAFVALAIVLAGLAVNQTGTQEIDTSLDRSVTTPAVNPQQAPDAIPGDPGLDGQAPVDPVPQVEDDPLAGVAQ